jgi:hypothetical protein
MRSGVSRAYYSAYCTARNFLLTQLQLPREDAHKFVWQFYNWTNDPPFVRVANLGKGMKRRRVQADYHDNYPGPSGQLARDVQLTIQDADEVLNAIPTLSQRTLQHWAATLKRRGGMT